jgi:hypothetical protein
MSKALLPSAFASLLERWPELAGFCGARTARAELTSLSPELARDRIRALEELARVADDSHDAELLAAQAKLFHGLLDGGRWRANPDVLSEWSSLLLRQAIDASQSREEAQRLEGWLVSIPGAIVDGRDGREHPDPTAWAFAKDTAQGLLEQLRALSPLVSSSALSAATDAVTSHLRWLESLTPAERLPPLGREELARWLAWRHIDESPEELVEQVEQELNQCRDSMGNADLDAERARVKAHHAGTFKGVLAKLDAALREAQSFAAPRAGLPSIAVAPSRVESTPAALRPSIPGAAVFTPRALLPDEEPLVLLSEPESLSERCDAHLDNLAVHEGYPGHGLQAALANAAGRPWRAVDLCPLPGLGSGLFACELMEGWAHFAEECVAESFTMSYERLFVQRDEALWRAARARVDLGIHLGEFSDERALSMLIDRAGLSRSAARDEIEGYRLLPTYGLSYLLGKLKLRAIRMRSRRFGSVPDLYRRLLSEGLVPLSWLEKWVG